MTMAPGRKKRGYLLEIILVSILLFLLWGSLSQSARSTSVGSDLTHALKRGLAAQPVNLK